MSRVFRLDWEGALHHVMARGVARGAIFLDPSDRDRFSERLQRYTVETGVRLYAWVLMPNHIHLLAETGSTPLWKLMHKLLGGHATYFNMKHDRVGHLFQNRFHSILVESEYYMKRLIRYIHLNPLKAGIAPSPDALDNYRWSSHSDLVGPSESTWWMKQKVIDFFDTSRTGSIRNYREFLVAGMTGCTENLDVGNFHIGSGGLQSSSEHSTGNTTGINHEILGSRSFAEKVLHRIRGNRGSGIRSRGIEHDAIERIIGAALIHWRISRTQLTAGRRTRILSEARGFVASCLIDRLGLSLRDAAGILHMSPEGVGIAAGRFRSSIDADRGKLAYFREFISG